jgi:hypothetical protein
LPVSSPRPSTRWLKYDGGGDSASHASGLQLSKLTA